MFKKLILGIFVLIIFGQALPAQATWEGAEVTGTVFSSDFPGQFDWPDPVATISFTDVEFTRIFTNVTTTADFTENMLILTYENTSSFPNITYPPLTYTFVFQGVSISDVNLVNSTFSSIITSSFTANSITLEVPLQNTNPGEIFTAMFDISQGIESPQGVVEDTCKESDNSVDPRNDVDILSASYNTVSDSIEVCAVLCADVCMPSSQYRFHFDYDMAANGMASYLSPDDRDEGSCSITSIGNMTGTTSDDTVRFVCDDEGTIKKVTGPTEGCYTEGDGKFCCTVARSSLVREVEGMVAVCDVIDIWMDVHNKGIQDRAPDTDDSDGCSKPTGPDEVLLFKLDGTAPEITCPPDVTLGCNDSTDPSNTGEATATDDCDPSPTISSTDASTSSCPAEETITRTWTAADESGNESSCDQTIDVVDDTPPSITCPDDIEVFASSADGEVVEYPDPQVSDNCEGPISVNCDPPSGYQFPVSETTVTCTASDACGNEATCWFTVIINQPQANLGIAKHDSSDPVLAGQTLVYTLDVTNIGPDAAENVVVTDTLPAGVTLVSTSGCAEDPNGVPSCSLGDIPAGLTVTFEIEVTVDGGTSGTITNTASVASDTADPVSTNNSTTEDTVVNSLLGSIGDTVFEDTNANGIQDPGEPGIPGVPVLLKDAFGTTTLATAVTDANGNYLFDNLPAGTYTVDMDETTLPPGSIPTSPDPRTVPLAPGEDRLNIDFGYFLMLGRIGDLVWSDDNVNGIQDFGESGIPGVSVLLKDASGTTTLATDVTDANGNYLFDNLPAGTYTVDVDGTTLLPGLTPTSITPPITVPLAPGEYYLIIDFGYFLQGGSIGDRVWNDLDRDGIQDAGEPGVSGVTVTLLDGSGNPVTTSVTDGNGKYQFDDLIPGNYKVRFSGLPPGFEFTVQDTGDDTVDSDADPSNGETAFVTLSSAEFNDTLDAGIYNIDD